MRKLEDGTYMYDTDSPWSHVAARVFALAVVLLMGALGAYLAWTYWTEQGVTAFKLWKGVGLTPVILAFNMFICAIWLSSGLRRAIRVAKVKENND